SGVTAAADWRVVAMAEVRIAPGENRVADATSPRPALPHRAIETSLLWSESPPGRSLDSPVRERRAGRGRLLPLLLGRGDVELLEELAVVLDVELAAPLLDERALQA